MTDSLAVVQPQTDLTAIERVVVAGDLSKLSPSDRWDYYKGVCQSVGLNPFTQPFMYITLSGKLTLYATKGAADQLRSNHHISISQPHLDITDGLCIVTVNATDHTGRTDSDLGIVPIENLRGDAKANAILKAVTKAKRRVTLSMCGLGMLDETEIETIPNARPLPLEEAHGQAAPLTIDNDTVASEPDESTPAVEPEQPEEPLTVKEWWSQLVKEAEAVNLPTLGQVKAIDPEAVSEAQLQRYAELLDERIEKTGKA